MLLALLLTPRPLGHSEASLQGVSGLDLPRLSRVRAVMMSGGRPRHPDHCQAPQGLANGAASAAGEGEWKQRSGWGQHGAGWSDQAVLHALLERMRPLGCGAGCGRN